jgi:hypothetical protein
VHSSAVCRRAPSIHGSPRGLDSHPRHPPSLNPTRLSPWKATSSAVDPRVRDILHPGSRRPALSAWMCAAAPAAPEEPDDGGFASSIPLCSTPPPPPSSSFSSGGAAVDTGSCRAGSLIRGPTTVGARTRCGVVRLQRAPRRWRRKGRTGAQTRERVAVDDLVTCPSLSPPVFSWCCSPSPPLL